MEALLRGNEVAIGKARKKPSKADLKKIEKAVAAKRKAGEECYTEEELENAGLLDEKTWGYTDEELGGERDDEEDP